MLELLGLCTFSRDTFTSLGRWLADARALGSGNLVTILVGNKADREDEREVEWEEASRWAAENGSPSIQTHLVTLPDARLCRFTLYRDILGDGRQCRCTIPASRACHPVGHRERPARPRKGWQRCILRRPPTAAYFVRVPVLVWRRYKRLAKARHYTPRA